LHHFQFTVGMRLHFLIFSALAGVPFVALPYASKVTSFMKDLGLEVPAFEEMNPGRLIAHIDRAWDLRGEITARLRKTLPLQKQRARHNNALAVDLLRGLRDRPGELPHQAQP
jgi:polysaccharide pyruvyl transferase WcaK-like protein